MSFLVDMGVSDSGVSNLIKAVYHLLGLRTYLTSNGEGDPAPWTIPTGAKAAPGGRGHSHGPLSADSLPPRSPSLTKISKNSDPSPKPAKRVSGALKAKTMLWLMAM